MNRHNETKEFFQQVAFDFITQLREIIEAKKIGRSAFATLLGVTRGRVSQILNRPSNLTLDNIVKYARRLNQKVAIVLYDDGDRRNKNGPILPQIFVECWKRQGRPRNFFDLNRPVGPPRLVWNQPSAANVKQLQERFELCPETAANTGVGSIGMTTQLASAH